MFQNTKIRNLILIILPFLAVVLARNIYISFFVKVKTEFAQVQLFDKMIDTEALVLRNEKILKDDRKFLKVVCDDNSKIASGQSIAEVYSSEDETYSAHKDKNVFFVMKDINNRINDSIRGLIHKNEYNNDLDFLIKSQDLFLNKKIYLNNEDNPKFSAEIKSDCNGFYSCSTDGFEQSLDLNIDDEKIKSLVFDNYKIDREDDKSIFGKIVYDDKCLILCHLDKDVEIKNKKVKICFQLDNDGILCDLLKVVDLEKGDKLAVFSSNVNNFLINARLEKVKIKIESAEGIKILKSCIHEQEGQIGVFVLDRKVVKFKPISINYENDDFVLCEYGQDDEELNQNDLIITSGDNLYDGKVLMF